MPACSRKPLVDNPPETPTTPTGPVSGRCDSLYLFTASAADPDSDSVALRFDWGDGRTSAWTVFVPSGTVVGDSCAWHSVSACSVKAQARDIHGALSDWSPAHLMPLEGGPRFADSVIATIAVGSFPEKIAASADERFVYVTNYEDNTVSVISTASNEVIATFDVGERPWGIAVHPNGSLVYVTAENGAGAVYVIRTSDYSVIDTIEVGEDPTEIAILPDGSYLYVIECDDGVVHVIRTADNTLVATLWVGEGTGGIAVTPDGTRVLVSTYDGLVTVDVRSLTILETVPVGNCPTYITVLPDGSHAYVSVCEDLATEMPGVCVVRLSDFQVVDTVILVGPDALPGALAATADGAFVFALIEEGLFENPTVAVINTRFNRLAAWVSDWENVEDEYGPYGVVCLSDGRVYVANEQCDYVTVFGYSTGGSCARAPGMKLVQR